jgi:hypothetical protein
MPLADWRRPVQVLRGEAGEPQELLQPSLRKEPSEMCTKEEDLLGAINETLDYFDVEFSLDNYPERENWPVSIHAGGLTVGQLRIIADYINQQEQERLRVNLRFIWKTIERAKWSPEVYGDLSNAINTMAAYPDAPWNNKDLWEWDTSHKDYDEEIKKFAEQQDRQALEEPDQIEQTILSRMEQQDKK